MTGPAWGHVLVVDDDPVSRLLAGRLLEQAGARVTMAEDGHEAVRRAGLETFDAVVMDIHLPDISGLDACRLLRSSGVRVPIIGLTGDELVAEGNVWRDAGMDGCLRKPLRPAELQALLSSRLKDAGGK